MSSESADLVRWVGTPVAALSGGVVAWALLGDPPLPATLATGLIVGAVVALADWIAAPEQSVTALPASPPTARARGTSFSQPSPPNARPAPTTVAEQAPASPTTGWWTETPRTDTERAPLRQPPPDLASYLQDDRPAARIPQCPRCGDFNVGARMRAAGHDFTCLACGECWNWMPGAPWPAVQIDPRVRG